MQKRYLVVASKSDLAGMNIVSQLRQFGDFNFYICEDEIIRTENLDLDLVDSYDFVIFASRHESKNKKKAISIHAPGNWKKNEFGGEFGKVCVSSALFQKRLFEYLDEFMKEYRIENYGLTLEATHHGPLIKRPCVFVEIGSTAFEWKDRKAGFVVAKAISETIGNFAENPYHEIAIAVGGKHYCSAFNKIQLNSNVAISHVIPSYVFPITEELIQDAIDKTEEDVDIILIDSKGLGNSEQKKQTLEVLNKFYLPKKRTSEIRRD